MFDVGFPELMVILLIVLIIFGGGKLPQIGESLGKAIKGFKKGISESDAIEITPKKGEIEEKKEPEKHV